MTYRLLSPLFTAFLLVSVAKTVLLKVVCVCEGKNLLFQSVEPKPTTTKWFHCGDIAPSDIIKSP